MPGKGLEPPRLAAFAPEASASTNFATRASLVEKSIATAIPHFVSGCKSNFSTVIVKSFPRFLTKMSCIDLLLLYSRRPEFGYLMKGMV